MSFPKALLICQLLLCMGLAHGLFLGTIGRVIIGLLRIPYHLLRFAIRCIGHVIAGVLSGIAAFLEGASGSIRHTRSITTAAKVDAIAPTHMLGLRHVV